MEPILTRNPQSTSFSSKNSNFQLIFESHNCFQALQKTSDIDPPTIHRYSSLYRAIITGQCTSLERTIETETNKALREEYENYFVLYKFINLLWHWIEIFFMAGKEHCVKDIVDWYHLHYTTYDEGKMFDDVLATVPYPDSNMNYFNLVSKYIINKNLGVM